MYVEMGELLGISRRQEDQIIEFVSHDARIHVAVLLFHVVVVDGRGFRAKLKCYHEILEDHMNVSPDEMRLFEKMTKAQFRSRISPLEHVETVSGMSMEIRKNVLYLMEKVALGNNELHEFEINLLIKTAQAFGLSPEGYHTNNSRLDPHSPY